MPDTRSLNVPAAAAGERLDVWLASALDVSRSAASKLIDRGRVRIAETNPARSLRLEGGETVEVTEAVIESVTVAAAPASAVVFENDDLLVIDKPAGLVVHPAAGHRGETLTDQLRRVANGAWQPLLVHRLDRDTSGLMLVAKEQASLAILQADLRERRIERRYRALVAGRPSSRCGTVDAPIGRDRRNRTRMSVDTDKPRDAVTHFEVVEQLGDRALLDITLDTGRTHQIRAHMAAIGLSVCGDSDYGGPALSGLERQFLHSVELAFPMPYSGAETRFQSDLPADLAAVLARLQASGQGDR